MIADVFFRKEKIHLIYAASILQTQSKQYTRIPSQTQMQRNNITHSPSIPLSLCVKKKTYECN